MLFGPRMPLDDFGLMPRRIAVFRGLYLGDLLCAVPAVRALRSALPEAEITLIGLSWARSFVQQFCRYFDDFIPFPGYPGLQETAVEPSECSRFFAEAAERKFDLAIQMHGDGRVSNEVIRRLGAPVTAGYHPADAAPAIEGFFWPYPEHGHEIERNLGLITNLGLPAAGTDLEFPLDTADEAELRAALQDASITLGDYICVHPGARLQSRRWPAERFAAVADHLMRRGLQVVLTGSPEEAPVSATVAASMQRRPIDLTGKTSLGALGVLLSKARLVVTNDTGVSHIVAALHRPSAVIASGSDVQRWAPLDSDLHRTLAYDVDCRPCAHDVCPIGHPCALGVSVEAVTDAVDSLLEEYGTRS